MIASLAFFRCFRPYVQNCRTAMSVAWSVESREPCDETRSLDDCTVHGTVMALAPHLSALACALHAVALSWASVAHGALLAPTHRRRRASCGSSHSSNSSQDASSAPDLALLVGRHIRLRHVVQVDHVRKVAALHTAHEHARIGLPLSVDPLDNVGRIREVIVPVGR